MKSQKPKTANLNQNYIKQKNSRLSSGVFLYNLKLDYAFPAAIKFKAEPATNQPIWLSL